MQSAEAVAGRLGLRDVFALRRVSQEQLVNLAGVGRGKGWAGNICVDSGREPLITEALATGAVVRHRDDPTRIFGPYWADEAVLMTVGDFVIVMGGPGIADEDDGALMEIAGDLAYSIGDVPAEKRLADELEVTRAALNVATLPTSDLDGFLAGLADVSIDALGCEFGAVVIHHPSPRVLMAPSGWRPEATDEQILDALLGLMVTSENGEPFVAQDLRSDQSARSPLGFDEGLVSRCVVPLAVGGVSGAIVVAHTIESAPRGFTQLCQQVASSIGCQASKVLTASFADEPVAATAENEGTSR